jgi:monofunctional biosynthetic peptidoglycan transglycosylase
MNVSTYNHLPEVLSAVLIAGSLLITTVSNAESREDILYDFSDASQMDAWRIVNDGVMGGLSQSQMRLTGENTAIFEGEVSLDNYGGFASVRAIPTANKPVGHTGIRLRVKGDGKNYQLRLRTDNRFDGASYRSEFSTQQDVWTVIEVPFAEMVSTFRGRTLADYPAVDASQIQQLGFLISNKVAEQFRLEVDWIKAYSK